MSESWRTRFFRWGLNLAPVYWGTGGWLTYMAADWREAQLEIPLNWRTRNYVGTIFGGSMYGAVDPIYMLMYLNILGDDYIVWDKSATIHFKKPGRSTLHAQFVISEDELAEIRTATAHEYSIDRTYQVDLFDESGTLCATVDKVLYFRRKDAQRSSEPSLTDKT